MVEDPKNSLKMSILSVKLMKETKFLSKMKGNIKITSLKPTWQTLVEGVEVPKFLLTRLIR